MGVRGDTNKQIPLRTMFMMAVGVGLLLLSAVVIFDSIGTSALAKAMQHARAMGGPVTLQEMLDARPTYPDDRNGANIILAIKPALDELKKELDKKDSELKAKLPLVGDVRDPELGHRWSDATMEDVGELLARMKPQLDAIDAIKNCEGGRFPLTIPDDILSIELSHLSTIRMSVRLTALKAINRALQGDTSNLAQQIRIMLRTSRFVSNEVPLIISPLVTLSCEATTGFVMERILAMAYVDPVELEQIQSMFTEYDPYPRMIFAIRSERAMFIGLADLVRRTGSTVGLESSRWPAVIRMPGAHGRLMHDEARGIELYHRLLRRPDALGLIEEYEVLERERATSNPLQFFDAIFGCLANAMRIYVRTAAEIRCAELGMAAERHRIASGRWPSSLDALVPTYIGRLPEDPFRPGRPLNMVYRDGRLVIYSVGRDRQDDGGRVLRGGLDDSEADVGFILLDPGLRNRPALPDSRPASSGITG